MRTIAFILLAFMTIAGNAQNYSKYSKKAYRFALLHKGRKLNGGGCGEVPLTFMEKHNLLPVERYTVKEGDKHDVQKQKVHIGDYVSLGEGVTRHHFVLIIGYNEKTQNFIIAHQNYVCDEYPDGSPVIFEECSGFPTGSTVYGYKKNDIGAGYHKLKTIPKKKANGKVYGYKFQKAVHIDPSRRGVSY